MVAFQVVCDQMVRQNRCFVVNTQDRKIIEISCDHSLTFLRSFPPISIILAAIIPYCLHPSCDHSLLSLSSLRFNLQHASNRYPRCGTSTQSCSKDIMDMKNASSRPEPTVRCSLCDALVPDATQISYTVHLRHQHPYMLDESESHPDHIEMKILYLWNKAQQQAHLIQK
jgi:hypothetical protein